MRGYGSTETNHQPGESFVNDSARRNNFSLVGLIFYYCVLRTKNLLFLRNRKLDFLKSITMNIGKDKIIFERLAAFILCYYFVENVLADYIFEI